MSSRVLQVARAADESRTWLLIDIVAAIPLEFTLKVVDYVTGASLSSSNPSLITGIKLLRMLKLIRLWKVLRYFSQIKDASRIHPSVWTILQLLGTFFSLAHFLGLSLFAAGYAAYRSGEPSWLTDLYIAFDGCDHALPIIDAPKAVQYLMSVYWSFTIISTVGFGDLRPSHTRGEPSSGTHRVTPAQRLQCAF